MLRLQPGDVKHEDQQPIRFTLLELMAIVLAILAVFGSSLSHEFLTWDDDLHITANPHFQPLTLSGLWNFWRSPYEDLYIPLSYSVFAADVWITDVLFARTAAGELAEPRLFRLTSLLLHGMCCWLVFCLLNHVVSRSAALIGVLLFAIHPLQVESVAWTSEIRGLLAALFGFAALWCCWQDRDQKAWSSWQSAAVALLILALLSKPSAAAIVLMILVVEMAWLRWPRHKIALHIAALGSVVLLASILTSSLQPLGKSTASVPNWFRPVVALDALGWYLQKLVWPVPLGMDYGRTPRAVWNFQVGLGTYLWPLTGLILMAWMKVERRLWMAAGWFAAGLAPVLGLVPFGFQEISTVADRYAYVAMLGPALALSVIWERFPHVVARVLMLASLALLGVISLDATRNWRNSDALYSQALAVNPRSWIALHNQADLLAKRGNPQAAIGLLRKVLELRPQFGRAWHNLAVCLVQTGQEKQAVEALRQGVAAEPGDSTLRLALAERYRIADDSRAADEQYLAALELRPTDPAIVSEVADWFAQSDRSEVAAQLYERALRADADYLPAQLGLVMQLQKRGDHHAAITELEKALARHPNRADVRLQLGIAQASAGFFQAGQTTLQQVCDEAQRLQDARLLSAATRELAVLHNTLGVEALVRGQWLESERELRQAVRLDPQFAPSYFNLGRALAGRGAHTEARSAFEKSLSLLPAESDEARDVRDLLEQLPK